MDKQEKVIKHLEMIQGVINRLADSSFLVRRYALMLTTAIIALITTLSIDGSLGNKIVYFDPLALLPMSAFWFLDAYYLKHERLFRDLYNHIRTQGDTDFSMSTRAHRKNGRYLRALFSSTVLLVFAVQLLFLFAVMLYLAPAQ